MIRVLQVLYTLDRGDGSANVIMNFYRYIDKTLVQFDFLYFKDSENSFYQEILDFGGHVYKVPISLAVGDLCQLGQRLDSFFTEHKNFVAVHLNFPLLGYWVYKAARRNEIKYLISHSHSISYGTNKLSRLRNRFLFGFTRKLSNVHFACSLQAGEFLFGKKEVLNGNVMLVHNSIDCAKYVYSFSVRDSMLATWGLKDCFVLGHIGRFVEEKNHSFLIDIFAKIKSVEPKAILLLIGTGKLQNRIEERVVSLGLNDSVKFLGLRDDVFRLLQMIDVFVMPSLFEGLPITLVEAQAAGVPCVVSSNVPNDACLIPDIYSSLSLQSSVNEWCDNILSYRGYSKRNMLSRMQNKGFDIVLSAQQLQNWYLSLK